MIRAEVFRTIGLIDDRFFLIHEESDFCLRARAAGFNTHLTKPVDEGRLQDVLQAVSRDVATPNG